MPVTFRPMDSVFHSRVLARKLCCANFVSARAYSAPARTTNLPPKQQAQKLHSTRPASSIPPFSVANQLVKVPQARQVRVLVDALVDRVEPLDQIERRRCEPENVARQVPRPLRVRVG